MINIVLIDTNGEYPVITYKNDRLVRLSWNSGLGQYLYYIIPFRTGTLIKFDENGIEVLEYMASAVGLSGKVIGQYDPETMDIKYENWYIK